MQLNCVFLHVDFNLVAVMIYVNRNLTTVPGLVMLCTWKNSSGDDSCVVGFHSPGFFCSSARACNSWSGMRKLPQKFLE